MHLDQYFPQSSAAARLVSSYEEQPGLAECEMQIQQLKVCSDVEDSSSSPVSKQFGDENNEMAASLTTIAVPSRNVGKPPRATGRTHFATGQQEDVSRKLAPKRMLQKLGKIRSRQNEKKWMDVVSKARTAVNDGKWLEGIPNARKSAKC